MEQSIRNKHSQSAHSVPRMKRIRISVCLISLFLLVACFLLISLTSLNIPILLPVLASSFGLFVTAAILFRINPVIAIVLAGIALALLSFTLQSLGPERDSFGTECIPIQDCIQPVLGAGFPIHYVIDIPGITYQSVLGFEDDFRLWPFITDTCFYVCVVSLASLVVKRIGLQRLESKAA